jgi:tetratricopeptide (TPR) repeat protein
MKSGLWILILVLIAGTVVGYLLRGRLPSPEDMDEAARFAEIMEVEDSEAKIAALERFVADFPESPQRARAYLYMAREMLTALEDTARFEDFAAATLSGDAKDEDKAMIYYELYGMRIESDPEAAVETARQLVGRPIGISWIYNYMGYDLAERDLEAGLAVRLCDMALARAESRRDSSGILDSRGWAYYRKGMYDQAIADLERAMSLVEEPEVEYLKHLGRAALAGGYEEKAFEAYRSILVMGEHAYAREVIDSLMTSRGFSARQREAFDDGIWEARLAAAKPAEGFELPRLDGGSHGFRPAAGKITLISFMTPT